MRKHRVKLILEILEVSEAELGERLMLGLFIDLLAHDDWRQFLIKAGADTVLHKYDGANGIKDVNIVLVHESGMGLGETNEGLKHTDSLPVFAQTAPIPEICEVGLKDHLSLFTANWVDIALHIHYVLGEFVNRPDFAVGLFIILLSRDCKFEVGLGFVDFCDLGVYENEDQVKSTEE